MLVYAVYSKDASGQDLALFAEYAHEWEALEHVASNTDFLNAHPDAWLEGTVFYVKPQKAELRMPARWMRDECFRPSSNGRT